MGITARGAWETVKRHFREMDIDIQTTPFTVAGVGDMSGDVFGNGMLLSPKIRLVAAFDHRDIFIDPDPDMERPFAERQRLFTLARSSWQDFDKGCPFEGRHDHFAIGKVRHTDARSDGCDRHRQGRGNAVRDHDGHLEEPGRPALVRRHRHLRQSAVAKQTPRSATAPMTPFGSAAEDVRAKVIGEGANLRCHAEGPYRLRPEGGRCNSDAIDNSAGVNTSDVEVNIKIALAAAMHDNRLTRAKRDQLLSSMTEEVGKLVLRNNYLQSLAISLIERKGTANGLELARLMTVFEGAKQLNRKVETLPDDTVLAERYAAGKPLTRPEIGVLLSYAKIVLFDALAASDLPDDPYFAATLSNYFPAKMRKTNASDIDAHRLKREIIATVLANEAINRGGPGLRCQYDGRARAASAPGSRSGRNHRP